MGQGFSVNAARLRSGSQQLSDLLNRCQLLAQAAVDTLETLGGLAGYADLASALDAAAGQGSRTFSAMTAAYGHVSASLDASAANYSNAEHAIAERANSIFEGLR